MSQNETTDAVAELYAEFKVTKYGLGIRRIEYSPMLAVYEEWEAERNHYYTRAEFYGEDAAEQCQKRCMSELFKKQREGAAK
jgi:hypothetical protein